MKNRRVRIYYNVVLPQSHGHVVTLWSPIQLNHHCCRNLIVNPFWHSTRVNKKSSPVFVCTVRKLLTKVLIAHACLLLIGGIKLWQGTGQRNVCNDQRLKGESIMSSLGDDICKIVGPVGKAADRDQTKED